MEVAGYTAPAGDALDAVEVKKPTPRGQFCCCFGSEVAISANDQSLGLTLWFWASRHVLLVLFRVSSRWWWVKRGVRGGEVKGLGDGSLCLSSWTVSRSLASHLSLLSGPESQTRSLVLHVTFSPSDSTEHEWSVRASTCKLMPADTKHTAVSCCCQNCAKLAERSLKSHYDANVINIQLLLFMSLSHKTSQGYCFHLKAE